MKHATTREVFAYWDNCRGDRLAPERSDIEPGAIRSVLCDTFILTFDRKAGHPFRLAGTRLCAVMGCELKGEPFADLWSDRQPQADRRSAQDHRGRNRRARCQRQRRDRDGHTLDLELLLLPLGPSRAHAGAAARLALAAAPALLGRRQTGAGARRSATTGILARMSMPSQPPHFRAAPLEQAQRRGLMVLQGGRTD